jgi:hypothetical protein
MLLGLIVLGWTLSPAVCSAQFGRPIIVPRIPVTPHFVPHIPFVGHGSGSVDWPTLLAFGGGITVLIGAIALVVHWRRNRSAGVIRVVSIPPGEAPEEIRREWVGLELPLVHGAAQPQPLAVQGVLTHTPGSVMTGYAVDGRRALRLLASHSPAAAEWWRTNARHVEQANYLLIFPEYVCERLGG